MHPILCDIKNPYSLTYEGVSFTYRLALRDLLAVL